MEPTALACLWLARVKVMPVVRPDRCSALARPVGQLLCPAADYGQDLFVYTHH